MNSEAIIGQFKTVYRKRAKIWQIFTKFLIAPKFFSGTSDDY